MRKYYFSQGQRVVRKLELLLKCAVKEHAIIRYCVHTIHIFPSVKSRRRED
jgi:hypothetical protein